MMLDAKWRRTVAMVAGAWLAVGAGCATSNQGMSQATKDEINQRSTDVANQGDEEQQKKKAQQAQ